MTPKRTKKSVTTNETSLIDDINAQIIKLNRKKAALQSKLTNFTIFFESLVSLDSVNTIEESKLVELDIRINSINNLLTEFSDIQLDIENLDPNKFDNSETDKFETSYFSIIARAKQVLINHQQKSKQVQVLSQVPSSDESSFNLIPNKAPMSQKPGAKLPTIELPKFSGVYERWLEFKDFYISLVHNCEFLTPIDKFHYLRSSLEGPAARCIDSIEFCANNYDTAWDILCARYENKSLMVHNYIKALFNVKHLDSNSSHAFRDLVDVLSKNLKCLQSLDICIDSWDPLIIYLVTSKFDSSTIREWEKQDFDTELPTLGDLKSFLSNQADILEKVNMHGKVLDKRSFERESNHSHKKSKSFALSSNISKVGKELKLSCYYCKKPHFIYKCPDFHALSVNQKRQMVEKLKLCINCLQPGHEVVKCKSSHCRFCKEKHNSLLHPLDRDANSSVVVLQPSGSSTRSEPSSQGFTGASSSSISLKEQVLLATALVSVHDAQGKRHLLRTLLDSASMSNFITERAVLRLGLTQESVNFSVVGIGYSESSVKTACKIRINSIRENLQMNLNCLIIPNITGNLPAVYFNATKLPIPEFIELADPEFNEPQEVDLLIGAGVFWDLIEKDTIRLGKHGPVLQKTRLGWIISGMLNTSNKGVVSCHLSRYADIQKQLCRFWEIEEISTDTLLSGEESEAEDHFLRTHIRDSEGRFVVSVPLKEPASSLGDSGEIAKRQFLNLERKFASNPRLRDLYVNFMTEYADLSHMSLYKPSDSDITYYAPHHGVLREDSITTKLRVVFNCSAISSSGKSYNSIQMVGPTVQSDLMSILLRFRSRSYVITADICKMYRQILVEPSYRPLQLIFWRSHPEDPLQTFTLNTVTYGTASAPFLATRCLKQLGIEHKSAHPRAAKAIQDDFYMDDFNSGAESISETIRLGREVSEILQSGCFELRKWRSNSSEILDAIKVSNSSTDLLHFSAPETCKTLGMVWSCTNDTFSFKISIMPSLKKITKRVILSETAKIFDPLGLISPVVVLSKIILQSLWSLNSAWDQEIPEDLAQKWLKFRMDLLDLNSLEIPRHVSIRDAVSVQFHGFSDASRNAYGASIYVRSLDLQQNVYVRLFTSKTRVSPLKSITVPRLELCAALLLAQLFDKVRNSHVIQFHEYYLWSDSTVVLSWLRTSPQNLQVFVGNRVSQIQNLTDISRWRYVPTQTNPADLLSRGLNPQALLKSRLWFQGPPWLHEPINNWPVDLSVTNPISVDEMTEFRTQVPCFVEINRQAFPFDKYSSFIRLQRVMAYCLRFIHSCKVTRELRQVGYLSLEELSEATLVLVKLVQQEVFQQEFHDLERSSTVNSRSKLLSLTPFIDEGLIRVGGRLQRSSFSFGKKHPLVLPHNHHLTYLIFKHEHQKSFHCGPQQLLAHIRESFWPLSGRNLAKRIVRECIICFKFRPNIPQRIMGQLPEGCVSPSYPFVHSGVDYAGPFIIKDRQGRGCKKLKCFLCLFICLTTRAVHLELVTSLSTHAFLETFQRFVARRGKPSHVYSDNGGNFVGASNELRELGEFLRSSDQNLTANINSKFFVKWHFIPAYSPHQGGIWEAGIKSAKHHIKRIASSTLLTFENFYTLIVQIEGIMNSRPLTQLSSDPNDLEALTPAHFLVGRSLQSIPYPDVQEQPMNRLSHFQQLEQLKQNFWSRWSKEYISQLQQRTKWKCNKYSVDVGSLVLIRDDNIPPYRWKLGRIIQIHPGCDNVVRVVLIKTSNGIIKRAVARICPLPIQTV